MATVQNALGLLNLFSLSQPEIGLSEFKRLSGFDKGTTHRYLKALKAIGYLDQNTETKAYRLGPAIMRLAAVREQTFPIGKIVSLHVEELAARTGELVHASLLTDEGMSSLHHRDGGISGTRVGFDPAEILPLHATSSGMVMLAFGPPELDTWLDKRSLKKYTASTDTDLEQIREKIEIVKNNGYAALSETYEAEVNSVAVPFFDNTGRAVGSLSIATPSSRMTSENRAKLLSDIVAASRSMSVELGAALPEQIRNKWDTVEKEIPIP